MKGLRARGFWRVVVVPALVLSAVLTAAGDWPTYLHDPQRSAANLDETVISPANSAQLTKVWSYRTGGTVAGSPTVVDGTVYAGSWDGYEYALDAATGALKWKTFLGTSVNSQPGCFPAPGVGVTSAAAVQDGVVYVGGGDAYWYALDATSGAVLWKVFVGDNSAGGGHYNWSSPLLYNGYAYVGVASLCDSPLIQGQLLQISLSSQQVVTALNVVPAGQVGGSIWTSPSLDPSTNTLYVTTGNEGQEPYTSQPQTVAMLALDATTLAVKGQWQVPRAQQSYSDSDWSTSPILFSDGAGTPLVAAINKGGWLYAFNRGNVTAGPVWQQSIAQPGPNPDSGDGSVSSAAFDGTTLYQAGGNTIVNGISVPGSVRAFDPATGTILWQHSAPGFVQSSLAYANGLVVDGAGNYVEVLDAASGARLYSFQTGGQIYGLSIANGQIYAGSTDGNVYALGLPATPPTATPTPLPDAQCPGGWTCQDIGNPTPAGSEVVAGGTYTVTGGGTGIGGVSDQFRFLSQPFSGDLQVSAQVISQTVTDPNTQAGVMVRQSSDPAAPYYAVFLMPGNRLAVQYRPTQGGPTTALTLPAGAGAPLWLQIVRIGDVFAAATSRDGVGYTLVPGSQRGVVLPGGMLAGLAVSSHTSRAASTAVFNGVTLAAPSGRPATPTPPADAGCPSGWSCGDIGSYVPFGSESQSGGTWTVQGGGQGIGGGTDQGRFVWQTLSGISTTISARVVTQTVTNSLAQAGLMFRGSLDSSAPFFGAFMMPGRGVVVLIRLAQGYFSRTGSLTKGTPPLYLQIQKSGPFFSAATSADGVTWTPIVSKVYLSSLNGAVLGGVAVASHAPGVLSTATLDSVTTISR